MASELLPGVLAEVMARLAVEVMARGAMVLGPAAEKVAAQARRNASNGSHPYGTRTPASPGEGPARISGTLVSSIDWTPVIPSFLGWEARVGVISGTHPSYARRGARTRRRRSSGRGSSTPASRYGYYLETGLRNGSTYPFLLPAFPTARDAALEAAVAVLGSGWAPLI